MEGRELLVRWLKDAHAMETGLVSILNDHAEQAEGDGVVRQRMQQHAKETERHAELVEQCLDRLGSDPSGGKDVLAKMTGAVQGKMAKPAEDTLVKNSLSDFAAEHFEIASYRALVKAAETLGEDEVAGTCRDILREEEEMANFLEQQLSPTVEKAL